MRIISTYKGKINDWHAKGIQVLVCDEELKFDHVGRKKEIKHVIENKTLNILKGNENQACDSKPKFKHVGGN